jgi:hypothetical protein
MFNGVSKESIAFMLRVEFSGNTEDGCNALQESQP